MTPSSLCAATRTANRFFGGCSGCGLHRRIPKTDSTTECRYIVPIRIQEHSQNASKITSAAVMVSCPLVLKYLIGELDPAEERQPFHCLALPSLPPAAATTDRMRHAPPPPAQHRH